MQGFNCYLLLLVCSVVVVVEVQGVPIITNLTQSSGTPYIYSKFEITFNVTSSSGVYSNVYDPDIISVYPKGFF